MAKHRGRGVATINYPIGMNLGGDPSQALVHSNPTGKFTVALSSIDLGQGMKSVTRQICAETLGVPVEDVYVDTADSDTGPHCMGSFASRGTHRVGNAVMVAAPRPRCLAMISASWCRKRKKSVALRASTRPARRPVVAERFAAAAPAAPRAAGKPEPAARRQRAAACLPGRALLRARRARACGPRLRRRAPRPHPCARTFCGTRRAAASWLSRRQPAHIRSARNSSPRAGAPSCRRRGRR